MSSQSHKSFTERLEELNDPAYAQQQVEAEELLNSYYDLKKDIERIEAENPSDTQGIMSRRKALEELRPEFQEMEKKLHEMRGDTLPQNTPDDNYSHTPPVAPTISTDSTVHKIKTRTNSLDPIIQKARQTALNPDDYQSVWGELVRMAESDDRPAPLTGYAVEEGVLYRTENNDCVAFTKEALRNRFRRIAGR